MTVDRFIRRLAAFEGEGVFNPYRDVCPVFDRNDAPDRRRHNLRLILMAASEQSVKTIWIGRDLGYRGGRRTGLALTDEAHLAEAARLVRTDGLKLATNGKPIAERTATVIWNMLRRIGEPVMLWNVFPFHPHAPQDDMSNRSHTASEREEAWPLLLELLDILQPTTLVGIGRDAAQAIEGVSSSTHAVRHPSYGGQSQFAKQIESIYGLDRSPVEQDSIEPTVSQELALA
ncbi:uracil-DNA glycosylase [Pyruvatibacter sp.]|uniref:uracil-DNA glycosylase n=1 Tax=Pyruvatibacter sp. TaxID=1981328 RepID=UPI003265B32F